MQQSIFAEFAQLWPARFNNKTNGITPRRWLAQANPALAGVLDKYIGTGWRRDLTQLGGLAPLAHQPALIKMPNAPTSSAWRTGYRRIWG